MARAIEPLVNGSVWNTTLPDVVEGLRDLAIDGLLTDGAHHKQWFLEKILVGLGVDLDELRDELADNDYSWDPGIAP